MATTLEMYKTTGPYRKAYEHLNEKQYLGQVKTLANRNFTKTEDGIWFTQRVVAGKWFDPSNERQCFELMKAISAVYTMDCACEHDCCGHLNGWASIEYVKGREFVARARYYYNV